MSLVKPIFSSPSLAFSKWSLMCLMALLMAFGSAVHAAPAEGGTAGSATVQTVNINQADADQLARVLVGVGSQKAEAIVVYRTEHGPFSSLEELLEVNGIGPSTLERNRESIRL